jgi:phytanoyl-CoA hydroxylase
MLSSEQVERFARDGYLVLERAVDPALVTQVREHVRALRAGDATASYYKAEQPQGPLFNSHLFEPMMMRLVCQAPIVGALSQLLGAPPMICQSMFFLSGSRTRPHQDEFFMAPKPPPLIGSWIALQDVTPDDGPLGAVAGSHLGPVVLSKDIEGQWWKDTKAFNAFYDKCGTFTDASRIVPLTVRAGDVIFFHGRVIHCGIHPSTPDRPRWSMVSHHFRSDAVMDDSNNGIPVVCVKME